jgi:hypothetical protein
MHTLDSSCLSLAARFALVILLSFARSSRTTHSALLKMSIELDMGGLVEVKSADGIGGGRGVFAKRDISPGEVVFTDTPLLSTLGNHESVAGEPMHVQLARRILQSEQRDALLQQLACLYPQTLSELSADMLTTARAKHGTALSHLVAIQSAPALAENDVLCILLKVCFSAFCGGLYVRKAMLNHCCRPNCIAFQPGQRTSSDGRVLNTTASEVRADQAEYGDAFSDRFARPNSIFIGLS